MWPIVGFDVDDDGSRRAVLADSGAAPSPPIIQPMSLMAGVTETEPAHDVGQSI